MWVRQDVSEQAVEPVVRPDGNGLTVLVCSQGSKRLGDIRNLIRWNANRWSASVPVVDLKESQMVGEKGEDK